MGTFIDLPNETILQILSSLNPRSLSRSQQVCRKLHTLIANSPYCTYLLTLHSLGYALPAVPRLDLTIAECTELLRQHRASWSHPENFPVEKYELHPDPLATYKYIGGVFAQGLAGSGMGGEPTYNMHFHQLPSKNLGVGFKEWAFYDLGTGMASFTVDPDQNLLVLLESALPAQSPGEKFRVHLRTLDANEAHPRALFPIMDATIDHERIISEVLFGSLHMEVSGALVVILFGSFLVSTAAWIVVWDWYRGVEVTRVQVVNCSVPTFALLSNQALLLSRDYPSQYSSQDPGLLFGDTYGTLDVYTFDPSCDTSTTPCLVASFELPPLDANHGGSQITIRCAPSVGPIQIDGRARPKVYELPSQDRAIWLNVDVHLDGAWGTFPEFAGMLYVPFRVFFDPAYRGLGGCIQSTGGNCQAYSGGPALIPWDKWAHRTSWLDTSGFVSCSEDSMYGHRMASSYGLNDSDVVVIDLDQRRLRWRGFYEPGLMIPGAIPRPSGNISTTPITKALGHGIFCRRAISAQKVFVSSSFRVEEGVFLADDVIMDDEHG